jgi:WD40 repeat protein
MTTDSGEARTKSRPLPYLTPIWTTQVGAPVLALQFTGVHDDLVVLPSEGQPRLIDGVTGVDIRCLAAHDGGNLALAASSAGLIATGGCDGRIHGSTAAGIPVFDHHLGRAWIDHLAWNTSGTRLAAACGRQVAVVAPPAPDVLWSDTFPSTVSALAWRPGRDELAVAAYGGIWLTSGPGLVRDRHLAQAGSPVALCWTPDGNRLAAGWQDARLQVWDLPLLVEEPDGWGISGFERAVRHLAWNGQTLGMSGGLATVLCDFGPRGPVNDMPRALRGHADPVTVMLHRPNGGWITGDLGGALLVWHHEKPAAVLLHPSEITAVAWRDPDLLAIGAADGTVMLVACP